MKIGIFGTGMVGASIGSRLAGLGHQVMMGSRTANNEKAIEWASSAGQGASHGTFQDVAAFADVIFNCTKGMASEEVLKSCDVKTLKGKILVDVANPLDFSQGMPPTLSVINNDSLGERLQRQIPEMKVVKTLNTMNCELMVRPELIKGSHQVFICGNDEKAKKVVSDLLNEFGWEDKNIIDLGDISNARATEQLLPLWVRLYGKLQTHMFNFNIVQ